MQQDVASRVTLALDGMDQSSISILLCPGSAARFAHTLKIHDLWDRMGSRAVSYLKHTARDERVRVWADLKLNDTPQTVASRAKAVREAGAHSLTVHANAGVDSIRAALDNGPSEVIAITVLTSISPPHCYEMYNRSCEEQVQYLANLALSEGVSSLVCSGHEVAMLREKFPEATLIVPGVRMPGSDARGQKRIVTPWDAFKNGASRVVLGSEVTKADNPAAAFTNIINETKAQLNGGLL